MGVETRGAAALARLRHTYLGHKVYAYGGPRSLFSGLDALYPASTALRVSAIERERRSTWLGTGRYPYPYVLGLGFVAVDPVRIVFDRPNRRRLRRIMPWSASKETVPRSCLADWQVDITLSASPPPASTPSQENDFASACCATRSSGFAVIQTKSAAAIACAPRQRGITGSRR